MKCRKCGADQYYNICHSCMKKWTDMRTQAWEYLKEIHSPLTPITLFILQKEMKRLEKIWRRDPEAFKKEIEVV